MNPARKPATSRAAHEKEPAPFSVDYDHLSRLCLKYWKWLAGAIVLGVVIGFAVAATQTPIYASHSTILVEAKDSSVPGTTVTAPDRSGSDMLGTFAQMLQTSGLSSRVVQALDLNENPDFLPPGVSSVSPEDATAMLEHMISIHIRSSTRLIDITVEHRSPQMAQTLANKLAEESILQEFDQSTDNASVLSTYLQKEADRLQQKLSDSEHELQEYRSSHKQGMSLDENSDFVDQQLKDLNQQYMNALAQVTLLKERYLDRDPKLIQAQEMVDELRNELAKAEQNASELNDTSIQYKAMESVRDSYKQQLNNVLKALQDARVAEHVELPGISVEDKASFPYAPIRPNKKESVAIGGLAGLMIGVCFIFGLYFMDSSVRTVSQAENALGQTVIAAIPIQAEVEGKSILPTFSDPQSFVAESFRGLRATLLLQDRERLLKTILVASAIPGEGKSFCGANLAVAFAQAGLRTLLIDADLRLPTIHTYFNLPEGQTSDGFIDILSGKATLASAVMNSSIANLSLLLTTNPADAPAELLSGSRLPALLDEAAQKYDRIVIDSAPLNAVSDTMLIMQKTDTILLVVRASSTPVSESKAALEKIYSSKMKPLGLILNYLSAHTLKSYSYGYSYGQKPPKDKNAKKTAYR